MNKILEVRGLTTQFKVDKKTIIAVDQADFEIGEGETLAIVGESGSGKSVTALSIMQLVPNPPGKIIGGEILFKGEDLLKKSPAQMREIRGNKISMIFQEPMTSLNPVYTIGEQIIEAIVLHQKIKKKEARKKAIELLKLIGIPKPEERIDNYPHQLSGGMRQRVMIAMALSCDPTLLIADEPTTALDVTIQAQILDLIKKLKQQRNMAVMIITHDLGVVADIAQKVIVMYGGSIMEYGTREEIFNNPRHPYTQSLLKSIPRMDTSPEEKLYTINGIVPDLSNLPKGCVFSNRCEKCQSRCIQERPVLKEVQNQHSVRCWLGDKEESYAR